MMTHCSGSDQIHGLFHGSDYVRCASIHAVELFFKKILHSLHIWHGENKFGECLKLPISGRVVSVVSYLIDLLIESWILMKSMS